MEESAQDPRANSHADNSLAPEPVVLTGRRHTRHSAKRGPGSSTTRTHTLGVCGLGTHVMQAVIIQRADRHACESLSRHTRRTQPPPRVVCTEGKHHGLPSTCRGQSTLVTAGISGVVGHSPTPPATLPLPPTHGSHLQNAAPVPFAQTNFVGGEPQAWGAKLPPLAWGRPRGGRRRVAKMIRRGRDTSHRQRHASVRSIHQRASAPSSSIAVQQ